MQTAPPSRLESLNRSISHLLLEPRFALATRIVLCLPFWWSGLNKLVDFSSGAAEMAGIGLTPGWLFNGLTVLVQLGGSLLVILNRWTWLGAGALGVFTALATLLAHQFWTLEGAPRVHELNTFLEHLSIIAGFVLVARLSATPAGARKTQGEG